MPQQIVEKSIVDLAILKAYILISSIHKQNNKNS